MDSKCNDQKNLNKKQSKHRKVSSSSVKTVIEDSEEKTSLEVKNVKATEVAKKYSSTQKFNSTKIRLSKKNDKSKKVNTNEHECLSKDKPKRKSKILDNSDSQFKGNKSKRLKKQSGKL